MLSSPEGCEGCKSSWRKMALHTTGAPAFMECHAGLRYIKAPIRFGESKQPNAWLIAGQFYLSAQDPEIENRRLEDLAHKYKISLRDLRSAAKKIPVLKQAQQLQVQVWVPKVASTIESILCERSDLMARLQRIAELSSISPLLTEHT
jgi:ligand-binding sensor protein